MDFKTANSYIVDPPHIIHGDITDKGGYPTHTHGLRDIGLPEMMINATAFGSRDNAAAINFVFKHLATDENDYNNVVNQKEIEIPLPNSDLILCVRPVNRDFGAVKMAYPHSLKGFRDFAQIYVKGDDHVLEDSFYVIQESDECNCKAD